ncbi:membrane dipeptidase [Trichoderma harzianum]|uniref:Dipeptidase n=1 Tax=Trichoderma harzianum TaxID=5544 RepID=A0A0F9X817_TRIHA|nr:membrane dipeptidase [Trichoderma harzianum]
MPINKLSAKSLDSDVPDKPLIFVVEGRYQNWIKPIILLECINKDYDAVCLDGPATRTECSLGERITSWDSSQILLHLANKYDVEKSWSGSTVAEQLEIGNWLTFETASLGPTAKYWVWYSIRKPEDKNPKAEAKMLADLRVQYGILDKHLSQPGQTFIGLKDRPTIADIAIYPFADDPTMARMGSACILSTSNTIRATNYGIDGHNDFPFMIRGWHSGKIGDINARQMAVAHTDIERLRKGCVGGVFWSAYVPCPNENSANNFSTDVHYESLRATLQQIDIIHTLVERYPDDLQLAKTSKEVWQAFQSGKVASLIGVEGLHQIANSASALRNFHRLGVRYITLTHNSSNLYADSANAAASHHGGLSEKGREMIKEMNRIGMIVDLSHTSIEVQKEALSIAKAPLIFSHSSWLVKYPPFVSRRVSQWWTYYSISSSVTWHPRNSPDDVLDMLKINGGVFMVSFLRKLTDANNPTLSRVADHIQYVGERIGYEHVGIGSDFDGVMQTPLGLEDVSKFPFLVTELLMRGIPEPSIKGIVGLNVLRVLDEVQNVSEMMKGRGIEMLHDWIEPIWDEQVREEVKRVRGIVE